MQENTIREAALTMVKSARIHRQLFDRAGESFGLCRTHHIILMRLSLCDKIPTQKEFADALGITPAAVTGALKKLEEEGYLLRSVGKDNRKNEICITDSGRDLVRRTHEVFSALDASLFEDFTEEELRTFVSLTTKLYENMERKLQKDGEKLRFVEDDIENKMKNGKEVENG